MQPALEPITQSLNYGDLPETWRVPEIERFSTEKTLYDYQEDALRCAARALYLYYGKNGNDYQPGETPAADNARKQDFANRYSSSQLDDFSVKQYESNSDRQNRRESPVFKILSEYITPQGEEIPYQQLINRMCFWMATGSGKTLVMVKLVEYLHRLMGHGEIPPRKILILAPSDHLIGQIRQTIEEFNQIGLNINFVHLREHGKISQGRLGDSVTVYYHRSDNLSDTQKEALTDYRSYEDYGKWYVLLDEAHKGGKEDSKRQAYYAIMSRHGFLFNFSATFTDAEDIVTTVKKYNLEEFINNGHGKNIYLNEKEYEVFKQREQEISHDERRKIVLKSLITLAYVSLRVKELRTQAGLENLYHSPLMLTLVNSVNTNVENERNDLWAFFQTLRDIATGADIREMFDTSIVELADEWESATFLFREEGSGIIGIDRTSIIDLTLPDLREMVFLSRTKSSLQVIRSKDNKELAFQLKNADAPFALIRIGDTSKWRYNLLTGFEETKSLQEKSFFDGLEKSPITILMGSRSFFESWDSNRPNVINFINIGGADAKKFVVQSVGRGVRIETLPNQRRRYAFLPDSSEKRILQKYDERVHPAETLFLFATNRNAVKSVLDGLKTEKSGTFENLEGFEQSPKPEINGQEIPLLVPEYKEIKENTASKEKFAMSSETLDRFRNYLAKTSDSVLVVRDNLLAQEINELRVMAGLEGNVKLDPEKNYSNLVFLQHRLKSHLSKMGRVADGVRELDKNEDIVHFRKISAQLSQGEMLELSKKLKIVAKGEVPEDEKKKWALQFAENKINDEEFEERISGKSEETFKDLKIKNISRHYYVPVIAAQAGTAGYIKHIIKEESEVRFIAGLEQWLQNNEPEWDAWMFSKIDETEDKVHIPYYDSATNEYTRFLPDFIFWMCRNDEYQIVFVDPKGAVHKSAYLKIDGYSKLFEKDNKLKEFKYHNPNAANSVAPEQGNPIYGACITVRLLMFNKDNAIPERYERFWTNNPEDVFAGAANG